MRTPLRRYYGRGDLHFITFSCYRRCPLLGTPRVRDFFVRTLDEVRVRYGFRLFGYVVMPEHVHLLISEPTKATPSQVMQVVKQKVSRSLRRSDALRFEAEGTEEPAFWQRRFYDFNVWSAKKVMDKLEYMHENPVKRKLVARAKDWRWSSWSHYHCGDGEGLIAIDALDAPIAPRENPHP